MLASACSLIWVRFVIEDAFEHKADIGYSTRDALSPYTRADVERDALRIF